ncbi:peptidase inhibitor family I36 protein [Streptomyces griseoluteus]|uniref:peptidase inhibitor family I36 protein n=1 Tax=Streptomyces griseoluteus TaxID=29306 RepID=UPI0037012BAF
MVREQIACPRGVVCIYPDINFKGQPYVKRAVDGSVRHLPGYIRGKGSSIINNSSRTARVYQKDNYFGRHVCVRREGGTIGDLRSYQLNDTTHSLRNNDTPCGAAGGSSQPVCPGWPQVSRGVIGSVVDPTMAVSDVTRLTNQAGAVEIGPLTCECPALTGSQAPVALSERFGQGPPHTGSDEGRPHVR